MCRAGTATVCRSNGRSRRNTGRREKSKDSVPIAQFRKECREFAAHWIEVQKREFKRLGVVGDWDNPYTTMAFSAEAQIVREIGKFLMNGGLYKGSKPVMWSVVEQTALAEAEVEYHDHRSTTVWVRFPVAHAEPAVAAPRRRGDLDDDAVDASGQPRDRLQPRARIRGDPGRRGRRREPRCRAEGRRARRQAPGGDDADRRFRGRAKITRHTIVDLFPGSALAGTVARHPLAGQGYDFDVPLLPADFVLADEGTGLVHIAPGHGEDDWELGREHGIPVPTRSGRTGVLLPNVPLFAGRSSTRRDGKEGDANAAVIAAIDAAGALLARGTLVHSYPHSWRSKAPLIFRTTPQWFIGMETERSARRRR